MSISNLSKQIAKGTFWSLSGNMALKLISFFYLVMLTRMAPKTDIGIFYSALSIFGILLIFSDVGLKGSLMRHIPYFLGKKENEKITMLLKIAYTVSATLSIVITGIIFFGSDIIAAYIGKPDIAQILRLLSPYIILGTLFNLNTSFLAGIKNIRAQTMFLFGQNAAKLVLTMALFFFIGANLFSIAVGFLASVFIALLASFFYIKKPVSELAGSISRSAGGYTALLRDVVPFGMMISVISSFWLIVNHTDRLMILYFLNENLVATYITATSLAMLVMIFPSAISAIFFPVVSELFGKGKKEEMKAAVNTSLRWMLFIIMPLSLVLLSFPSSILNMFYGAGYAAGGLVLAIFTLGLLIRSLSFMQALTLAGMRLVHIELKVAAAAALVNVILNLALIPIFGIEGAAVASAIAFLTATLLFSYYSSRMFNFRFPFEALKAVLAGAIALALVFLVKPYLSDIFAQLPEIGVGNLAAIMTKVLHLVVFGLLFLLAGFVYLVVLFFLKTFAEEDVNILAAALRRAKIPEKWVEWVAGIARWGIGTAF